MKNSELFEWDASTYDALPLPHFGWGSGVVNRLPLSGDETVMDLGCGTGRDTERLLDRLPRGRVVAVDGSNQMLGRLRSRLAERLARVEIIQADLRKPLVLRDPVNAVMSVATLHWLPNHDKVFCNIASALTAGGMLVAEAGGAGNIAAVRNALSDLGVDGGGRKWNFPGVDRTVGALKRAGFYDVQARLVPDPVRLEPGAQLEAFLATVVLGPDLAALPAEERVSFVRAVAKRLPEPTVDYVRLQIEAVRGAQDSGERAPSQ